MSQKLKSFLIIIIYFFVLYVIFSYIGLGDLGTDDFYFKEAADTQGVIGFLNHRYNTWSTRILSEFLLITLLRNSLWLFPLIASLCSVAIPLLIIRLSTGKAFWKTDTIYLIASFAFMMIIPVAVRVGGEYWITGAFNYLIPTIPALIILIYFRDWIYNKKNKFSWLVFPLALLMFILNEQIAFAILITGTIMAFSKLVLLIKKEKNKKLILKKYLKASFKQLIILVFLIIGLIFILKAPGNEIRIESEIGTWFPEFADMSLLDKIINGVKWLVSSFFFKHKVSLLLFLPFIILFKFFKKDNKSIIIFISLFLGALASQVLMFLSPTIYASGDRIHYIYFIMINALLLSLLSKNQTINLMKPYIYILLLFGIYLQGNTFYNLVF